MSASKAAVAHHRASRRNLYALLLVLALIPFAAFAVGPLSTDDISLKGPGGPLLAFSAGVLSFISPCVLPMVPIYLTHLSGASVRDGKVVADRRTTFAHALFFVGAFSFVFIALGTSAGLLGSYFLTDNQRQIGSVAGAILVIMGILIIPPQGRKSPFRSALLLLGLTVLFAFLVEVAHLRDNALRIVELQAVLFLVWLRFSGYLQLSFFARTFELRLGDGRQVGYTRSALVGGAFALGWTPCIGPILASILTLAGAGSSGDPWRGAYLLIAYSAGLSIPFLIAGLALSDITPTLRRIQKYSGLIELAGGLMIIAVGVLLITGRLTGLNSFFSFADFNQGL